MFNTDVISPSISNTCLIEQKDVQSDTREREVAVHTEMHILIYMYCDYI